MTEPAFVSELQRFIEEAQTAAAGSPDVRAMEPPLVNLVRLVNDHPSMLSEADEVLAGLVPLLGEDPPPAGVIELLEYCVHVLDLPRVRHAAETLRVVSQGALEAGPSLRPWDHARRCEWVLAAAKPDWDGREMYLSLDGEPL